MKSIEKIVKAQKTEERAEESLVMKRLYTAFLEGGMDIDEACEVLRSGENDEKMKKMEMDENREKRQAYACGQGLC